MSIEADIYPRRAPGKSDLIDGAIGELSGFHQTLGYYAHGADQTTATLPAGWPDRLVPLANDHTGGSSHDAGRARTERREIDHVSHSVD